MSGGVGAKVEEEIRIVSGDECTKIEEWVGDLIADRKRREHARHAGDS